MSDRAERKPESPTSKPRRRRALLAFTASTAMALLLGEVLVRVIVGAPLPEREPLLEVRANEFRGWEMVPGVHYTYQHPVNVNQMGLRGPEVEAKRPGELRVLMLGDSQLFGQGVADDETVPAQAERRLAAVDERPISVVNAGHRAYDTAQELGLLRQLGDQIDPDVVVVWFYWNDVEERDIPGTYERLTESGPIVFDLGEPMQGDARTKWYLTQMLRRSALVMFLYDQFRALNAPAALDPQGLAPNYDRFATRVDGLLEEQRDRGFRLYFALLPDAATLVAEHFSADIVERAGKILADKGIATIDLRPALRSWVEENGALPVVPYDFHYDARGHGVTAGVLVDRLIADGVVGGG